MTYCRKHIKKACLIVTVQCIMYSCAHVGYNYSGVHFLKNEEKLFIKTLSATDQIADKANDDKMLYRVTAEQLKQAMSNYEHNVVYEWNPRCGGGTTPAWVYKHLSDKGYKTWVVLRYYYPHVFGLSFGEPVLLINEQVYETHNCNKYNEMFFRDLGYVKDKKNKNEGLFYLFNHSEYFKCIAHPDSIKSVVSMPEE